MSTQTTTIQILIAVKTSNLARLQCIRCFKLWKGEASAVNKAPVARGFPWIGGGGGEPNVLKTETQGFFRTWFFSLTGVSILDLC
jgi:hypothetical protein